jgi:hypothetical protein
VNAAIRVITIARTITIRCRAAPLRLRYFFSLNIIPGPFQFPLRSGQHFSKILGLPFQLLNATESVISYRVSCTEGCCNRRKGPLSAAGTKRSAIRTLSHGSFGTLVVVSQFFLDFMDPERLSVLEIDPELGKADELTQLNI